MVIVNHIVVKNGKLLDYSSISTFTVISDIIPSKKRIALPGNYVQFYHWKKYF